MSPYLSHHGILGMHWGVRRTPEELGHRPKRTRSSYKRDFREARKQGRKSSTEEMTELLSNTHKMSNSELEYAIRRIEYQQKIQNLTEKQREMNRSIFSRSAERIGNRILDKSVDAVGEFAWGQLEQASGVALRDTQKSISSRFPKARKYLYRPTKKTTKAKATGDSNAKESKTEMSYDELMDYLERKELD